MGTRCTQKFCLFGNRKEKLDLSKPSSRDEFEYNTWVYIMSQPVERFFSLGQLTHVNIEYCLALVLNCKHQRVMTMVITNASKPL